MREFSHLVDALHKAGMECLMEFYFDGSVSPSAMLDILHYWKMQYHVDGFHLMGSGICQEVLVRMHCFPGRSSFFMMWTADIFTREKNLPIRMWQSTMKDFFTACAIC